MPINIAKAGKSINLFRNKNTMADAKNTRINKGVI